MSICLLTEVKQQWATLVLGWGDHLSALLVSLMALQLTPVDWNPISAFFVYPAPTSERLSPDMGWGGVMRVMFSWNTCTNYFCDPPSPPLSQVGDINTPSNPPPISIERHTEYTHFIHEATVAQW